LIRRCLSIDAVTPGGHKVGFYGLDLYSLHASMKAVLRYLEHVDPEAAKRARGRYSCFDQFGKDTQVYGFMTRLNLSKSFSPRLADCAKRALARTMRDGGSVAS
jgi:erythromycin esterase-like protein